MQADPSWIPIAIPAAAGMLGVTAGALIQPWISARLERRRFAWEQRRGVLDRLRKLQDECAFKEVEWELFHDQYVDLASDTGIWFNDSILGECHEWMVELLDASEVDRATMQRVLLAIEILVSSRLAVEAGSQYRIPLIPKRRRLKKALKDRKLPEKYIW